MKLEKNDYQILKGAFSFLLFFMVLEFKYIPFELIGIDANNLPTIFKCIYTILTECIVIVIILIMYKDYISKCIKDFKKNKNNYFKKYIKYWFIILIATAICNLIINLLNNGNIAGNEETVRSILKESPLYTWISAVLIAPIIEELAFRLSFKSMFKYKWIFIILSGIVFGSFHLIGSVSTYYDLLYLIPYSIPGCIFAYTLYDSDNIIIPMSLHMLHNGVTMSLQILLIIFVDS